MPFTELAFFADIKRKVVKTHRSSKPLLLTDIRLKRQKFMVILYTNPFLFTVFKNFRIRFYFTRKN